MVALLDPSIDVFYIHLSIDCSFSTRTQTFCINSYINRLFIIIIDDDDDDDGGGLPSHIDIALSIINRHYN